MTMEFSEFLENKFPNVRLGAEWRALILFEGEETTARVYLDHLAQDLGQTDWESADFASIHEIAMFMYESVNISKVG